MTEILRTEADAVASLAAKPFVEIVNGVPHAVTPDGNGSWSFHGLDYLMPAPTRKRGTTNIHDVESFIAISKQHGSLSNCCIYLDVDYENNKIEATAVFNDHGQNETGWRDHRSVFNPKLSKEWKDWAKNSGAKMTQVEFALFLETNLADIASLEGMPSGAEVLAFVTQLQETRKVKYGSAVNLQNGMVQIEFIEDGDNGTKGKLEVFKQFAIGIRPFANGDAYQVKAFLRYRIDRNTGQIQFWYDLQRADRVLEDASRAMVEKIRTTTGLPVVFGTP